VCGMFFMCFWVVLSYSVFAQKTQKHNVVKDMLVERQTHTLTHSLITILRSATGGEVIYRQIRDFKQVLTFKATVTTCGSMTDATTASQEVHDTRQSRVTLTN